MRFNSGVDKKLYLLLFVLFFVLAIFFIVIQEHLVAAILFLPIAYISHLTKNTYYEINGKMLLIKAGFLYKKEIDIETIRAVHSSINLLSAPALSFDRLEIKYNKYDSILISPKNKQAFIQSLLQVNNAITIQI
jgi:hypothetical protein